MEETPRFSGRHRRWGRPFGAVHPLQSALAILLALLALGVLIAVMFRMGLGD
jgi:hypothetical protein